MPKIIDEEKIYDVLELSQLLGVSVVTIYKYMASGKIKSVKVGKKIFVSGKNLSRFINGEQERITEEK